ncbi:8103_t:CDS:2 [Racocetra fulgida]|uniref:8103_t:CDS:1 n=1 Tax=Racocetra fulgida TaxID=60492 RepID=A0A9N9C4A4_9GLOM|nr:8103_t:CDS:2 [Racocetra fulgida]
MCEKFVMDEEGKISSKYDISGNVEFGRWVDQPEKLEQITRELLEAISPKYKLFIKDGEPQVNEGSYVCEVIAPLINIAMNDLPGHPLAWASAVRKGSQKIARRPDYMLLTHLGKNAKLEISYLETGRPNSTLIKRVRDHKKLARFSKDSIDTTRSVSNLQRIFSRSITRQQLAIFTVNVADLSAEESPKTVESENIKLKQSFKEYAVLKIRFEELEKKNKADTDNLTAENIKLKDKVTKLEQIQTYNVNKKHIAKLNNNIKKIKQISILLPEEQYSANINASCEINSESNFKQIDSRYGNTFASDITDNTSNSDEPDGAFSNISENVFDTASNPNVCQETVTQYSASICMETKSSEDKEIEKFLDQVHKENSNKIRERNQKKKLQSQGSVQNASDIQNKINLVIDQAQNSEVKIPYNKKVEQDLKHDLSLFIKDINNNEDKSLPETKVSASSNPIHDYIYFCNKILEQYPNLYKECSDRNDDYYRITDNTLCLLCRLNYSDDDIEGEYKNRTYYIKCKPCIVQITA